jgi:hypothetical protein
MTDKHHGAASPAAQGRSFMSSDQARTIRIRELNDQFRQSLRGGSVFITAGVHALGADRVKAVLIKARDFDTFGQDNDPYGEHDFGSIEDGQERFFWKIDYYDLTLTAGSPDPSDSDRTCRVLTVMLGSEY